MRRFLKYVRPYLLHFILAPVFMLCEVWGEIQLPAIMADIINIGATRGDVGFILGRGGIMLAIALFMITTGISSAYFAAKAATGFSSDLRRDVFVRVQSFSFKNLDEFSTGSLVTRLTNDITQLENLVMMSLRMLMRAPGMLIGGAVMAYLLNPPMSRVVFAAIPVMTVAIAIVVHFAFPRFRSMQGKVDNLNNSVRESLTNVRIIKSFVREGFEQERFEGANSELMGAALAAFNIVVVNIPLVMLIMNATTLGVVWVGGRQVMAGTMPVGDLTAMITYIIQILMSLMILAMILLQSSRALASGARILEVLEKEVDLTDEGAALKDASIESGAIEFRGVSFSYHENGGERILKDINLTIPSGAGVGIIGSTGSGKSSLVQLIPRLYDVSEGQVLVDGKDVRELSLKTLRDNVSMVLQKNVLFSGTVAENLRWGDENADDESVRSAAVKAQAHGFVSAMEEGYDTRIARGGANVSGGQKQRLCIARALLKKPRVIILDDSTSAVDTATEAMIRQAFAESLFDVTKLIIAQRITSVIDMDMIVVLEKGQIVGQGTHSQLMESCETYREIYYSQMEETDDTGKEVRG